MNNMKFDKVRKGYSIEEVDSYIAILQEEYSKHTGEIESHALKIKELEKSINDEEKRVNQLKEQDKAKRNEILKLQQLSKDKRSNLNELRKKYYNLQKENSDCKNENNLTKHEEALGDMHYENEQLVNEIKELNEQISDLETQLNESESKDNDGFSMLQNIFSSAMSKAELTVKELKDKTEEEIESINTECNAIIEEAKKEAKTIQDKMDYEHNVSYESERKKIENERERLRVTNEEFLSECNNIREDAKLIKKKADEDVERIIENIEGCLKRMEYKESIVESNVKPLYAEEKMAIMKNFDIAKVSLSAMSDNVKQIIKSIQ